jgi:HSP20 family molecular chaperone IbpA
MNSNTITTGDCTGEPVNWFVSNPITDCICTSEFTINQYIEPRDVHETDTHKVYEIPAIGLSEDEIDVTLIDGDEVKIELADNKFIEQNIYMISVDTSVFKVDTIDVSLSKGLLTVKIEKINPDKKIKVNDTKN